MTHMNVFHVLKLMAIASQLSGYDLPPKVTPPQVIEFSIIEMRDWACPLETNPVKCQVWGQYPDNDTILVDAEASNMTENAPSEDAVVIHEMVHWLQDHHGIRGFECPLILKRETEAYAVQNLYIQRYEHSKVRLDVPKELCKEPE